MVVLLEGIPQNGNGGGITGLSTLMSLRDQGMKVILIALSESSKDFDSADDPTKRAALETFPLIQLFVSHPFKSQSLFRRFLRRGGLALGLRSSIFWGFRLKPKLKRVLQQIKPDAIIAYHWSTLAAVNGLGAGPVVGLVGDPISEVMRHQFQLGNQKSLNAPKEKSFRDFYATKVLIPRIKRLEISLLKDCEVAGAFAFHYTEEFRKAGVACLYFRTPIPRPGHTFSNNRKKKRILHIGSLRGTATLSGLRLMIDEVIPALDALRGSRDYDVHLVGGFFNELPGDFRARILESGVTPRGQIVPPNPEFVEASVVLVPIPIELGIRVRILTALSYGSPVVAHIANTRGIPELAHSRNCLIGNDANSLAAAYNQLLNSRQQRETLSKGALQTCEQYFSPDVAGKEISQAVVEILSHARARKHSLRFVGRPF